MFIAGVVHKITGLVPQLQDPFGQTGLGPVNGQTGLIAEKAHQLLVNAAAALDTAVMLFLSKVIDGDRKIRQKSCFRGY